MRNRSIIIFLAILIVAGGIFYYLVSSSSGFNWYPSYRYNSNQPYGCEVITRMLDSLNPGKKFNVLQEPLKTGLDPKNVKDSSLYVFVGNELYSDSMGLVNLFSFIEKGNEAFVASKNIPDGFDLYLSRYDSADGSSPLQRHYLPYYPKHRLERVDSTITNDDTITSNDSVKTIALDSVKHVVLDTVNSAGNFKPDTAAPITNAQLEEQNDYFDNQIVDSTVSMNFYHPALKTAGGDTFSFIYDFKKLSTGWKYLEKVSTFFEGYNGDSVRNRTTLGYFSAVTPSEYHNNNQYINFVRYRIGKGYLYMHSNPIAFTNYFLVNPVGFDYASKVFTHFKPANIYWDEYSRVPDFSNRSRGGESSAPESPLNFLLSQPSLRWAWYILLSLILLFGLFKMKREQRVIPIPEPNINTSAEFITTVGRLYFLQNDHVSLARQKMKLFLQFVRHKYNLSTRQLDAAFIDKLAEKAHVPVAEVNEIFVLYKLASRTTDLSTNDLIQFHQAIEHFYKQCK